MVHVVLRLRGGMQEEGTEETESEEEDGRKHLHGTTKRKHWPDELWEGAGELGE